MARHWHTSNARWRRALLGVIATAAVLIAAQSVPAATDGPGFAPTHEEVQKTARDLELLKQPEPSRSGGFPTEAVVVGASVGAGIGLAIVAFARLAGRRRGHPVSV